MLTDYLVLFILAGMISAGYSLECFRCVYDQRKEQGAKVWNAVRRMQEDNDPACFKPDRYTPPAHLVANMQRCSANQHCNKQMWYYRESRLFYMARGCDDVCRNEVFESVDYRGQGYDRQDVTYTCCNDDRCNAAAGMVTSLVMSVVTSLTAVLLARQW